MDPVQGQLESANQRDIERMVSNFAPDVRVEDGAGNLVTEGHEGLRALYGPMLANSPVFQAEVLTRIRVGNYVIDEERVTGIVAEEFPSELHAVTIFQVEGNLITHMRILS